MSIIINGYNRKYNKCMKKDEGQVESAGKSRQRVKGASPYIVKDSDQLWSPSHASATRKGAAKR